MTNEGLAIEIKNLAIQIVDLKAVISQHATTYITNEVFELRIKEVDVRLDVLKAELHDLNRRRWVQNTLSAILGMVVVILVEAYLRK